MEWRFIYNHDVHDRDVIDLDELTLVSVVNMFGAIYWWMVKFGFAIAGGLSGAIFFFIGFDTTLEVQPESAIIGLRLFFSGLPILELLLPCLLRIMIFLKNAPMKSKNN